jgi:hypothetical protein
MDRFDEITRNFQIDSICNDGKLMNITLKDIEWLIEKNQQQNLFIKELRDRLARFEKYWEVAEKQQLKLNERTLELQQEVDYLEEEAKQWSIVAHANREENDRLKMKENNKISTTSLFYLISTLATDWDFKTVEQLLNYLKNHNSVYEWDNF